MLYRASENDFLISKFHEKCDNIPFTLILCETQHGKVIGGFTSFKWYKPASNQYVPAEINSPEHFMFSLTNNHKFTITQNPQNCIYLYSNDDYGPRFGGGDFYIYNKAN